jgi:hypothetical protein
MYLCSQKSHSVLITTLSGTRFSARCRWICAHCSVSCQFRHVTMLAKITFYAGNHAKRHASSLQAVVGFVHTVQYRSHFRHVTLIAILNFYSRLLAEWLASSVQAVVGRVHTVHYRRYFRHVTMLVTSLSMLVNTLSVTHRFFKLSLYVCKLFTIGVNFVISPCSIQTLFMLVTTLSGTRRLSNCRWTCAHCSVSESFPSCDFARYSHYICW